MAPSSKASRQKYPEITVNELNPDAGSADEIEAIKANKDNKGPQAPDVIDVGLSFGPPAKAEGLIQPYKVSTWDSIPDRRQGRGRLLVRRLLRRAVLRGEQGPRRRTCRPRLGRPAQGRIRQARSLSPVTRAPPTRPSSAFYAAGLSQGAAPANAGEGRSRVLQGAQRRQGNFVPVIGKAGTLAQGTTPILDRLGLQRAVVAATRSTATRRSTSSCRQTASSPASTSRPSAPTLRIRTPRSSGWNTSTRTKVSSAG